MIPFGFLSYLQTFLIFEDIGVRICYHKPISNDDEKRKSTYCMFNVKLFVY
jgi:hypothetical protein